MQKSSINSHLIAVANLQLPAEQQKNPAQVLECFFKVYPLTIAKQQLSECVETALITDNLIYDTPGSRAELMRFYHFIENVLEAAYIIRQGV